MTTYKYKGYTVNQIGLSHYIYKPSTTPVPKHGESNYNCDRIEGSKTAAKRWINQDIANSIESSMVRVDINRKKSMRDQRRF